VFVRSGSLDDGVDEFEDHGLGGAHGIIGRRELG